MISDTTGSSKRSLLLVTDFPEPPYDAWKLEHHGFDFTMPRRSASGAARKVRDVWEHRRGLKAEEALRGISARADAVVCVLEPCAPVPLQLRRLGLPPYRSAPITAISCWLAETLRSLPAAERKAAARPYLDLDLLMYFSESQTGIYVDSGFREEQLSPIPFGVTVDGAVDAAPGPQHGRDIELLAVGFDRGRDYATLFDALRGRDAIVELYCRPSNLTGLDVPSNVRVHAPVPFSEYSALLDRAAIVVVPTHELAYPTGQSVAMEASVRGACVVATSTEPLREYFTDGSTALLAELHDPNSLWEKIEVARQSASLRSHLAESAREMVLEKYTTDHLWAAVAGQSLLRA